MNNEIKEILDYCNKYINDKYMQYSEPMLNAKSLKILLDYITNLEQENEELKLLCQTQNNREYRSKFLKDFQKEHGKNVFPDYDEIYKRYDNFKSRNEKAIEKLKSMLPICIMPNNMLIHGTEKAKVIEETINILEGDNKE